jgi:hypothetical protein
MLNCCGLKRMARTHPSKSHETRACEWHLDSLVSCNLEAFNKGTNFDFPRHLGVTGSILVFWKHHGFVLLFAA